MLHGDVTNSMVSLTFTDLGEIKCKKKIKTVASFILSSHFAIKQSHL